MPLNVGVEWHRKHIEKVYKHNKKMYSTLNSIVFLPHTFMKYTKDIDIKGLILAWLKSKESPLYL